MIQLSVCIDMIFHELPFIERLKKVSQREKNKGSCLLHQVSITC